MIYSSPSSNIWTIDTQPIVCFKHWFGHNLSPDASFDFSNVPVECHEPLLNQLINQYENNRRIESIKHQPKPLIEKILFYKLW